MFEIILIGKLSHFNLKKNCYNEQNFKGWVTEGIRVSSARKRELHWLNENSYHIDFKRYVQDYKIFLINVLELLKNLFPKVKLNCLECSKTENSSNKQQK